MINIVKLKEYVCIVNQVVDVSKEVSRTVTIFEIILVLGTTRDCYSILVRFSRLIDIGLFKYNRGILTTKGIL